MAAIPGRSGCWFLAAATAILLCAISIAHAVGEADPLFHPDINGVVSIIVPQPNGTNPDRWKLHPHHLPASTVWQISDLNALGKQFYRILQAP